MTVNYGLWLIKNVTVKDCDFRLEDSHIQVASIETKCWNLKVSTKIMQNVLKQFKQYMCIVQPLYTVQYCTWFKNQDRQQRKICHHSETTASRVYINNYSIIVRNKTYRYRKYLDRKRINVAVMNFILDCYKKVSGLVTKIYTLYYNSSSR